MQLKYTHFNHVHTLKNRTGYVLYLSRTENDKFFLCIFFIVGTQTLLLAYCAIGV